MLAASATVGNRPVGGTSQVVDGGSDAGSIGYGGSFFGGDAGHDAFQEFF